ncbi:alpha/beta fold hydrolase [Alterisphingorhabdus coralli]|uniref:Alpha/beta hydrolase n=1 Tax=Alterisphingorhabdus coralli TaxID=3071408 RepID=A0AA97F850_9SPHN|nr:alpha/beta hydrolase [Parasphingorhabdus sp. SCSIO 66989]WOE75052.1 alpha/beta hydrolase [Parasphingorhabdus sp. SCSIO 66989]
MRWAILLIGLVALGGMSVVMMFVPYPNARARATDGVEHSIARDGRNIAYFVQGGGPVVVLLPSAGREASDFNELADQLNYKGYRTISIEPPGIGNSDLPDEDMTLFDLADDVRAVLDAELASQDKAVILGHAFGNRVARATAAKHGERIDGVILLAAGGKQPIPPRADAALKGSFNPLRTSVKRLASIRYAFFAGANRVPEHWQRGWHIATARLQGRAVELTNTDDWWLAGDERILVVQGEADTIAPPEDAGQALVNDAKGRAEIVIVEKAGHALLPEQPDAVETAVLEFLAKLQHQQGPE